MTEISPGKALTITPQEFDLFRYFIERETGITLEGNQTYLVESRLGPLLAEEGCRSFGELYRRVSTRPSGPLRDKIINAITTHETLWFRDKGPLEMVRRMYLPQIVEEARRGRLIFRIWSAACSTGQEPYTLAMIISDFCSIQGDGVLTPENFEIIGTDISAETIETAKAGVYDKFCMSRGLPEDFARRYFKPEGRYWVIDPTLKKRITFLQFNLLADFSTLGTFDLILCCNVCIYFSNEGKRVLFQKMKKALGPGGIFLLGAAENLSFVYNGFKIREFENVTFYQ